MLLTKEEIGKILLKVFPIPDVLGDKDILSLVDEVERAVLAKAMPIPKQEPVAHAVYQGCLSGVHVSMLSNAPKDFSGYLYAEPQPAQAAAIPNKRPIPELLLASYHEAKGWNDCIDSMLSASKKPE